MIQITRALARQLRAVLRKAAPVESARNDRPSIAFHASPEGLQVHCHHAEVAVELHLPGPRPNDALVLPHAALDDLEGRQDSPVSLTVKDANVVEARWEEGGMPQVRDYPTGSVDRLPPFPAEPKRFASLDKSVLQAFADAVQTAARNNTRPGLTRLQLRGKLGEIVSTDSRQLLIQRGFTFPWKDDLLIPAMGLFGGRELPPEAAIAIGKSDTHVCLRIGPWKFHLAIDRHSRYPRIEQVIPARSPKETILQMPAEDVAFLAAELPRLPSSKDLDAEVTVDLNGHAAIRIKDEANQTTELLLGRSSITGPPVRLVTYQRFLAQAAKMGFGELHVAAPDSAIVCCDLKRIYAWMPLSPASALPPTASAKHLSSTGLATPNIQPPSPSRRTNLMPQPLNNGHPANGTPSDSPSRGERSVALVDLIAEAEELRAVLADASSRLGRLLSGLKQHRRDSRAMQAAMQSLKQIKLGI